jgi:hypothetical protein
MKEGFAPPGLLDLFLPKPLYGFAIDRDSRVSLPCFRTATPFPEYVLMEPPSVAVWLKNRVIVAIAIGLWVINASVAILGEFFPLYSPEIPTDVV